MANKTNTMQIFIPLNRYVQIALNNVLVTATRNSLVWNFATYEILVITIKTLDVTNTFER